MWANPESQTHEHTFICIHLHMEDPPALFLPQRSQEIKWPTYSVN